MSEERVAYLESSTTSSLWADVRFADGKHTGVRVLRGTSIIEIMRDRRRLVFDIAECALLTNNDMMLSK